MLVLYSSKSIGRRNLYLFHGYSAIHHPTLWSSSRLVWAVGWGAVGGEDGDVENGNMV